MLRSQAKPQKWWPPIARQLFTKAEIRPGGTALQGRPSLFFGAALAGRSRRGCRVSTGKGSAAGNPDVAVECGIRNKENQQKP
jgi:hypothetical protein